MFNLNAPLVIFSYFYLRLVKFYRLMNLSKIRKYLTKESFEIAVHVAHVGLFDPERSIKSCCKTLHSCNTVLSDIFYAINSIDSKTSYNLQRKLSLHSK